MKTLVKQRKQSEEKPMPEDQKERNKDEYWHPRKGCWIRRKKNRKPGKYSDDEKHDRHVLAQRAWRARVKTEKRRKEREAREQGKFEEEVTYAFDAPETNIIEVAEAQDGLYVIRNNVLARVEYDVTFLPAAAGVKIGIKVQTSGDNITQ